jgi:hypothetical protein
MMLIAGFSRRYCLQSTMLVEMRNTAIVILRRQAVDICDRLIPASCAVPQCGHVGLSGIARQSSPQRLEYHRWLFSRLECERRERCVALSHEMAGCVIRAKFELQSSRESLEPYVIRAVPNITTGSASE